MLFISTDSHAQASDSIKVRNDTAGINRFPSQNIVVNTKPHSPRKAALMSTALPGLGQVYNKKYWKVPLIYACVGGLTYSFQFNQRRYVKYRDAYKYRIDGDESTVDNYVGIYSDDNLSSLYSYYHRYRDLTVIGFAAVYLLNIVDAAVDAHLYNFDVSDNLSMEMRPAMMETTAGTYQAGLTLSIKF